MTDYRGFNLEKLTVLSSVRRKENRTNAAELLTELTVADLFDKLTSYDEPQNTENSDEISADENGVEENDDETQGDLERKHAETSNAIKMGIKQHKKKYISFIIQQHTGKDSELEEISDAESKHESESKASVIAKPRSTTANLWPAPTQQRDPRLLPWASSKKGTLPSTGVKWRLDSKPQPAKQQTGKMMTSPFPVTDALYQTGQAPALKRGFTLLEGQWNVHKCWKKRLDTNYPEHPVHIANKEFS